MITLSSSGDFNRTFKFLRKIHSLNFKSTLAKYAQMGVDALIAATPVDSGQTANSWSYTMEVGFETVSIHWTNSNVNKGVNIAVILQFGHGTGTGGYVQGRDYINPAMRPVFDKIADELWKEVVSA